MANGYWYIGSNMMPTVAGGIYTNPFQQELADPYYRSSQNNTCIDGFNSYDDIYVFDSQNTQNLMDLASASSTGTESDGYCGIGTVGSANLMGSNCLAISADGRFITFASVADNLIANTTQVNDSYADPRYDPNVSFSHPRPCANIYVHDRATGTTALVSSGTSDACGPCAINADGRYIAYASGQAIYVYDRLVQQQSAAIANCGATVTDLAINPDGRYIRYGTGGSFITTYDQCTKQSFSDCGVHSQYVDGQYFVSTSQDGTDSSGNPIYMMNLNGPYAKADDPIPPFPPYASGASPGDVVNLATGELDGMASTDIDVYNAQDIGILHAQFLQLSGEMQLWFSRIITGLGT